MRVAHVNPDPGIAPGRKKGAAVHVEAMRRAFAARGAEVLELDVSDDRELHARLETEHRRAPIDVLYERHALARYACAEFAARAAIPHVIEVNAPLAEEEERYRGGRELVAERERERAAWRGAALVLAVSTDVGRYAVERGADAARVLVRPNAVDPELFRPRSPDDPVRERLVPAGRIAIGFHGRLRPWHNFERCVDAFVELVGRGHDLQLVLLGEGDFEAAWRGRVDPQRVSREAWLPHAEAARVVAAFDLLPLTYAPDAPCYFSPLKLLEAMACAAVPIVPDLGDLPAAVRDGSEGLVYRAGDQKALVAALERCLVDRELCAELGRGARRRAERQSWQDIAREVLEATCGGVR
ncbi:MAG: glycosyltransferase family 4 protein [Planctomycetes bacterium]|nr:glycosyltransferase family 4 protein [Planctomycetota bacterium]